MLSGKDVLIVGCGGICYHALSLLKSNLYDSVGTVVGVDPDVIEEGNLKRQWCDAKPGTPKAEALAEALAKTPCRVKCFKKLWDDVSRHHLADVLEWDVDLRPLVVFAWTDSAESRMQILASVRDMCVYEVDDVTIILAGNDAEGAVANGERFVDGKCVWPLGLAEAQWEWEADAAGEGESCNAQTSRQNHMAAQLSFKLLELMEDEEPPQRLFYDNGKVFSRPAERATWATVNSLRGRIAAAATQKGDTDGTKD